MLGKKPDKLRDEIDELREEHEQVLTSLNNDKSRHQEVLKNIKEGEDILKSLTSSVDSLIVEIEQTKELEKERKANAEEEIHTLIKNVADLKREVNEVTSDRDAYLETTQAEIDTLVTSIESKKAALLEFTNKIEKSKEKLADLKLEISGVKSDYDGKKLLLKEAVKNLEEKNIEIVEAEEVLQTVQKRIEEDAQLSLKRVSEREAKVIELEKTIGEKQASVSELEIKLQTILDTVAEQETAVAFYRDEEERRKASALSDRNFHQHLLNKEERLRSAYEEIGMTYPEFKG